MAEQIHEIVVLGAGISGLSVAHWLRREGHDVQILEAGKTPGGSVRTIYENGFLVEEGPNSGLETTPAIKQLVEEVGLRDQMIYANEEAKKRYILKNNQLLQLPTTPPAFIKSNLFSAKAKMRLFAEPFIGRSNDGHYQSVAEFVIRRLGREFLDYAIDPFVSGIFAGDPNKLSVKSAFPKLYHLEEEYGGLIKGMIKGAKERKKNAEVSKQSAKMFSFKNGMASLPQAIANELGDRVKYNAKVETIVKTSKGYKVIHSTQGAPNSVMAKNVVSTVPAYQAKELLEGLDDQLAKHLNDIYYPPVTTLYLGYKKIDAPPLDGFGFLIPSKENKNFLGAIWNSSIFPNRASDDCVSFTLFIGGARNADIFKQGEKQIRIQAIREFQQIMSIQKEPVFRHEKFWAQAIPQYNLGYIEHERYFERFEEENPGLYLAGNYRGGISFGDCVKNAKELADRINFRLKS